MQDWFIASKYNMSNKLALVTFALTFIVILLGAYTRLSDAGLSCPDWPHCYGYLTAPHTQSQLQTAQEHYPTMPVNIKKAWTEMTHRYFAGFTGLFIVIFSCSILFSRKTKNNKFFIISIALLTLLCMQVLLGMLTVTEKLKPLIVLAHLLTGLSLLSLLWWAYLDLHSQHHFFIKKSSPRILPWLWLGFFIVSTQITLGGWVSTHYAGLACIDFPFCNGKILPALQWHHLNSDLISIHMLHRIGAILTATYLSVIAFFLFKYKTLRNVAITIFLLLLLQLTLGILNIILLRPTTIALTHHAVAILLLLTIITALVKTSLILDNRYVTNP